MGINGCKKMETWPITNKSRVAVSEIGSKNFQTSVDLGVLSRHETFLVHG